MPYLKKQLLTRGWACHEGDSYRSLVLSLLSQDVCVHLGFLVFGTFDCSELSACQLDGSLFLGWDLGLDQLAHFALKGHQTADLGDNFAHALDAGVFASFPCGFVLAEGIMLCGGLSHDETFVQSDE